MQNVNVQERYWTFKNVIERSIVQFHSSQFIIIQNHSFLFQNWMNMKRECPRTLNIHIHLASFLFNIDHVHFLILNCDEWKWTFTWSKLNKNEAWMFRKVQFYYMWMAKVVPFNRNHSFFIHSSLELLRVSFIFFFRTSLLERV